MVAAGGTYIHQDRKEGAKDKDITPQGHVVMALIPSFGKKDGPCMGNRVLSHQMTFSQEELGTFPVRGCPAWEAFSRLADFVWSEVGVL